MNMPLWAQIGGVLLFAFIAASTLAWLDNQGQRRAQKRYETWPCPKCGRPFGPQTENTNWVTKRDPQVTGKPTGGPILFCSNCNLQFAFDTKGREVNDQREYVG